MKADEIGRAIADLAAATKEPVWFHGYKGFVAGGACVLIECSESFLERVKKIDGVHVAGEVSARSGFETERNAGLEDFYAPAAPKKPAPKGPAFF